MATKKKSGKKAAKVTKKAVKKQGAGTGRKSKYAGKKITKLTKENPRRPGSAGHKSFALISNGMTYEQYIAKGGRRTDLEWDVKHKHVKVAA
jgi:hypothetical protein